MIERPSQTVQFANYLGPVLLDCWEVVATESTGPGPTVCCFVLRSGAKVEGIRLTALDAHAKLEAAREAIRAWEARPGERERERRRARKGRRAIKKGVKKR